MTCENPSDKSYRAGCRCEGCKRAHAAAAELRELRNARGESYYVDAGPARERLQALYAAGYTKRELDRLGIRRSAQQYLTEGHPRTGRPIERVKRTTAERLEAVSGRSLKRKTRVPAEPAHALLMRWRRLGIPMARVARVAGVSVVTIDTIVHRRRKYVNASTLVSLLKHKAEIDDMAVFRR